MQALTSAPIAPRSRLPATSATSPRSSRVQRHVAAPAAARHAHKSEFPRFRPGMSTADYVRLQSGHLVPWQWAQLNDAPCTLYSGEDTCETLPDGFDTWEDFDAAQGSSAAAESAPADAEPSTRPNPSRRMMRSRRPSSPVPNRTRRRRRRAPNHIPGANRRPR